MLLFFWQKCTHFVLFSKDYKAGKIERVWLRGKRHTSAENTDKDFLFFLRSLRQFSFFLYFCKNTKKLRIWDGFSHYISSFHLNEQNIFTEFSIFPFLKIKLFLMGRSVTVIFVKFCNFEISMKRKKYPFIH